MLMTGVKDFQLLNQHPMVQVGTDTKNQPKFMPKGQWWLNHPLRCQYDGIRFEPGRPQGDRYLNLWRGWGIEPRKGDWSLMREHIRRMLACGNEEYALYIERWMAWTVQNPGKPAEAALVLRGDKGTGKGLTARCLASMFGQHALAVANPRHITGQFNAHLQDCCFLFADEAFPPNDKKAEAVLKMLITEPTIPVERKGVDVQQARNCIHLMMASNDSWVVPADMKERRFAVFKVSDEFADADDDTKEAYFAPLFDWLNRGGPAHMLHDLLSLNLEGWHPRRNIPQTDELLRQKDRTLRGLDKLIHEMLKSGRALGAIKMNKDGSVFIATDLFIKDCGLDELKRTTIGRLLGKLSEAPAGQQRVSWGGRQYSGKWIEPLRQARQLWEASTRVSWVWSNDAFEWDTGLPDAELPAPEEGTPF